MDEGPDDIVGHKTFDTGEMGEHGFPVLRHEPLTRAEGDALWQRAVEAERLRAERMPDEQAAIHALWDAHQRLKELGWKEPQYCPKDGTYFKVIELGSTGIFDCYYQGEWKDGLYMVSDGRDVYPTSDGVAMFKLLPEDQAKEDERWKKAKERFQALATDTTGSDGDNLSLAATAGSSVEPTTETAPARVS
jgi:hypothetical protein